MDKHQKFLEFNGKTISFLNKDGVYWVAVKPICEALNVVYTGQLKKLKNHQILGPALYICTMQVSGKGGIQSRNMTCIPEKFIYGWLFSINSDKPEFIEYQKTCYELLYNYFHGTITGRKELLIERLDVDTKIHHLKNELKENDNKYKELHELQQKRKRLSGELNSIDTQIINQTELFTN